MAKITFILGGARSGKSAFAEGLAMRYKNIAYIATAEAKDDEMLDRIRMHQSRRPSNWKTIESPYHADKVVLDMPGNIDLICIDCITLYITNMLLQDEIITNTNDLKLKQKQICDEITILAKACRKSRADVVMVSNEIGLGIVPENILSRLFRDIAGRTNQILAEEADEVYFLVAGIAQKIK
ncbi:MAG: bifunctional adenosylcobinamide kinase/adenosylcobinamide-phosphate guanylyltransferase [Candidatus Loosdrechtia sp.]|uniref:bifunctional adenosylcobinamide kinase/adenosylcobinamide-phosphate guanylyltransferase n=1 Tax=Candidatus Loosdrechtia sp. TaxID=3101272 RepID=UPI003A71DE79|nr:MAG: bifunctional adenosylcobinamide kinase/adenosylcobinamide-phosphate guanylyltransferase [Candidatus Jettenia sp. AMX2]